LIGHHNVGPTGVSGALAPDQKASTSPSPEGECGTQFCQSHEQTGPDDNRSFQLHLCGRRERMKWKLAKPWKKMVYSRRSEALVTAKKIAEAGIDPQHFLDAQPELRRAGIMLNPALKLAHQDSPPLDYSDCVLAAVQAVEGLTLLGNRLAKPWNAPSYPKRSEALALAMWIAEAGIDPQHFLDTKLELRRVGVLLRQVLKLSDQDRVPLDHPDRVLAAVLTAEGLTS